MNNTTSLKPPSQQRHEHPSVLIFSPLAWLKLQFFLHAGDTEIGGFGISGPDDLLYIEDFVTVRQKVTSVTVEFDDVAVADHFDQMVDKGLEPRHFSRIWIHTHPGFSALPSTTDERTFQRVFGQCDWSIMFIIARSGQMYARLRFAAGPQAVVNLSVRVDWEPSPRLAVEQAGELGRLVEDWVEEYYRNIEPAVASLSAGAVADDILPLDQLLQHDPDDPGWELEDLVAREAAQRGGWQSGPLEPEGQ